MAVQANGNAPYAPPSAIISLLERLRQRGLQTPLDKDVLIRAGVTESLAPRTIQALEILDLIDSKGNPTPTLEGLRMAPEHEYRPALADAIRSAYAEVFNFVDPVTDDPVRVRDAFRGFVPHGQQSRMVTLFFGLCEAAGIVEQAPKQIRRPAKSSSKSSANDNTTGTKKRKSPKPPPHVSGLPEPISGLLSALPSNGWTKEKRDQFLSTFGSVLDFCIPIVEAEEEP